VYGTFFYGTWDTPFKALYYGTKADDPFGSTDVYGANNVLGSPGFRTLSGGTTGFDIRRTNSVAYWTPKIEGFSARVQVGVNEGASNRFHGDATPNAKQLDPWLWSIAGNYDQGPLSVGLGYEQHLDFQALQQIFYTGTNDGGAAGTALPANAGNWSSRDSALRGSIGYEIATPVGPLTVAAVGEQLAYSWKNTGINQLNSYTRRAYGLSAKQRYGDHEFRARYNWAERGTCKFGASTPTAALDCEPFVTGLSARQYTLGYAYYLAASTQVYLYWERLVNGNRATYVPGAGGALSGAPAIVGNGPSASGTIPAGGLVAGADPYAIGLGMKYAF